MRFLNLLRSSAPASSKTLREALTEAETAAGEAEAEVSALVETRRKALLDGDDKILDRVERDLALAQREADRAELAAIELQQRLAQAEAAEAAAVLDQVHEAGQAALKRGVELIRADYNSLAGKLVALVRELVRLDAEVEAANARLAEAGDPRCVPDIDRTARPQRPPNAPFYQKKVQSQIALPHPSDPYLMLLPAGRDIFGSHVSSTGDPA